jgi:hypothetical protein
VGEGRGPSDEPHDEQRRRQMAQPIQKGRWVVPRRSIPISRNGHARGGVRARRPKKLRLLDGNYSSRRNRTELPKKSAFATPADRSTSILKLWLSPWSKFDLSAISPMIKTLFPDR